MTGPTRESNTVTLTATVGFSPETKSLTDEGVKTFAAGDQIAVIYKNTSAAVNDEANINYAALGTQDGTLASLAANYDLAVYDGTLTAGAALPSASLLLRRPGGDWILRTK